MDICIVTHEDCLHLNDPLKHVITHTPHRVIAVILTDTVPRFYASLTYKTRAFLATLLAMRTRYFVRTLFKALGCAIRRRSTSLEEFARSRGIPVFHVENPNSPPCIDLLRELAPDVIIHQSHFILKKPFLMSPRICTLNRHGSLLPNFRGMLAPFWALYESAPAAGVTIHTVDESIDGGKIVVQQGIVLTKRECLGSLLEKMFGMTGELFCKALDRIAQDKEYFRFDPISAPGENARSAGRVYKFPSARTILAYRLRRIARSLT